MAVENRDLGTSQQRETLTQLVGQGASSLIATGTTAALFIVPFPSNIAAWRLYGFGLSGAPTATLDVTRYNAAGVTTLTTAVVTQTITGATLAAGFTVNSGASALALQTNDIISLRTATANTAMVSATVSVVLQALQDIKTHWGV